MSITGGYVYIKPTQYPHGACRHPTCSTELFFVVTERGRRMPIDAATAHCANNAEPCDHLFSEHPEGGICAGDGCGCTGFHLDQDYNGFKHVSHWGTCKDPKRFSGRGGKSSRRTPKAGERR
jgi:hypothetical protein